MASVLTVGGAARRVGTQWQEGKNGVTAQDDNRHQRETLAAKLRLTAVALGCATRKELCAHRAVNPATEFDLERSYKWSQGRALPRSTTVYGDWVRVLGSERTNDWLAHCGITEFLAELQALHGIDGAVLLQRSRLTAPEVAHDGHASFGPGQYIAGAYACYSPAWSGYFRGKMIRGGLVRGAGPRQRSADSNLLRDHLDWALQAAGAGAAAGALGLPLSVGTPPASCRC